MVDMTSIAAAVSALSSASDIARNIVETKDKLDSQELAIQLQSQILAAQSAALSAQAEQVNLQEKTVELEKEIRKLKDWEQVRNDHELHQLNDTNVYVIIPRDMIEADFAAPLFCPQCFEDQRKSILVHEDRMPGRCEVLVCSHCGWEAYTMGEWRPDHAKRGRAGSRR